MPRICLPLRFKFQPTDRDLVSVYLLPKFRGENLPADFIRFSDDVYEKPPSESVLIPRLCLGMTKETDEFHKEDHTDL
ncbi:hypothetical protein SO802_032237 [Lithocarpus litseifolius]|uniref:NAC domain-containing protein n=1 Tax=Lithocarpus litseifolius TaxID=425828 RepID=A0AAW2BMJ8_9ROSI